jgi:hypothetical protein
VNNYPPGVTGMEPEIVGYPAECEDCDCFEDCEFGFNPRLCAKEAAADDEQERRREQEWGDWL